jgi:hypothetical protein
MLATRSRTCHILSSVLSVLTGAHAAAGPTPSVAENDPHNRTALQFSTRRAGAMALEPPRPQEHEYLRSDAGASVENYVLPAAGA